MKQSHYLTPWNFYGPVAVLNTEISMEQSHYLTLWNFYGTVALLNTVNILWDSRTTLHCEISMGQSHYLTLTFLWDNHYLKLTFLLDSHYLTLWNFYETVAPPNTLKFLWDSRTLWHSYISMRQSHCLTLWNFLWDSTLQPYYLTLKFLWDSRIT